MRVLHAYSGNLYGGVETMLVTLARYRELCPEMESHFALCFEGRLSAELIDAGAPVYFLGDVKVSQPLSVMRARRRLVELIRREHFDVCICHSPWSQVVFGPAVRRSSLPLIFWLHDEAKGRHWLERWASLIKPDLAICSSKFTTSTLPKIYPRVQTKLVYYPVPPPELTESARDRNALRAELNTPEDATVIIQVSRMEAWKGHQLHLEALSLLRDEPDWICWQVGGSQRPHEAQYLEQLKSAAQRLGIADRVRFLGQRSDVSGLLAAADIHCQPNIGAEPFGITFIEALFSRLPVVTTALGGACEIIDESCGILVPPGNVQALASALKQLIKNRDLRQRLGVAGPSRAASLCDPSVQMLQLYKVTSSAIKECVQN